MDFDETGIVARARCCRWWLRMFRDCCEPMSEDSERADGTTWKWRLVDTEGETAIDVFYLTHAGARHLTASEEKGTLWAERWMEAIDENAR